MGTHQTDGTSRTNRKINTQKRDKAGGPGNTKADSPEYVRQRIEAQDATFCKAMLTAIENGCEHVAKELNIPHEPMAQRITAEPVSGGCSSSAGWDYEPTRTHEGS